MATGVEGAAGVADSSGDLPNDCNGEDSNGEGALELDALLALAAGDSLFLHATKLNAITVDNNTSFKFTIIAPNSSVELCN